MLVFKELSTFQSVLQCSKEDAAHEDHRRSMYEVSTDSICQIAEHSVQDTKNSIHSEEMSIQERKNINNKHDIKLDEQNHIIQNELDQIIPDEGDIKKRELNDVTEQDKETSDSNNHDESDDIDMKVEMADVSLQCSMKGECSEESEEEAKGKNSQRTL